MEKIIENISRLFGCNKSEIHGFEKIDGGMMNESFIFSLRGEKYVYRRAGEGIEKLVDRHHEKECIEAAHRLGYDATYICMDGCEVVGAFMASELEKHDSISTNSHETVYVITPEFNSNNQMIFRDNLIPAIRNKHVLLLLATTTTGMTIDRSLECIQYYGGTVTGICSLFSAIDSIRGFPVVSAFTTRDIPGYQAYEYGSCPFCKGGHKLDAFVNGHGYSRL